MLRRLVERGSYRYVTDLVFSAMSRNIALIGFMAVGKSAIGRTLAKKLRRRFVDLDRVIERAEGRKVREIFEHKGEAYFRQLEKQALAEVLEKNNQIIATGGGVILDDQNLQILREKALLIGLSAEMDVLLARAGDATKRPLLQGSHRRERIEDLLRQRAARYAQAHVTIDTSNLTVDQVVKKIMGMLEVGKKPSDGNCKS
ncbi:MAG TPA: shikimate kinase [Candidatus Binatia bacterium]